jgi:hypothetical protein
VVDPGAPGRVPDGTPDLFGLLLEQHRRGPPRVLERVPHQSALPVGHDRYVALAGPALGSAEAHQPFADVVALGPHRGAQLGARGDAERGARRVVGLELGQELV